MTLGNLGSSGPLSWFSQGWTALRDHAHNALTYFDHEAEEDTSDAALASDRQATPQRWGIIAADVAEQGDHVEVKIEVPGLDREDLEVEISANHVTVRGAKRMANGRQVGSMLVTERAFGRFIRVLPLSVPVESEAARAELKNGILTIKIPKRSGSSAQTVTIE